jgi:hypothetical protein
VALSGDAQAGVATHVSYPGGGESITANGPASAAPGAQGLGRTMTPAQAVIWLIGGAAIGLVVIAVVFRRPIGES